MRWSEVYDSDADEVQRLQDEVDALRTKVEEVRGIVHDLEAYLPNVAMSAKSQAVGMSFVASLREALGDTEPEP